MIFAATFLITLVTIKLMKVFLNKSEQGPGAIEGVILGIMYHVLFLSEVFWFLFIVNPKMSLIGVARLSTAGTRRGRRFDPV